MLFVEKYILKINKQNKPIINFFWRIITLLVINFNWVIFNSRSLKYGIQYCIRMIGLYGLNYTFSNELYYDIREYWVYFALAIVFCGPVLPFVVKKVKEIDKYRVLAFFEIPLYLFIFVWAISFGLLGAHNPFLYQHF